MTTDDQHHRPGLPRLHQGHPAGDLGRDHRARVDGALRLRRAESSTTCVPAARIEAHASEEMKATGGPGGHGRGRGRSRPTRRAGSCRPGGRLWLERGRAPRSPTRSASASSGVCSLTVTHDLHGAPETAAQVAGTRRGRGRRLGRGAQRPEDVAGDRFLALRRHGRRAVRAAAGLIGDAGSRCPARAPGARARAPEFSPAGGRSCRSRGSTCRRRGTSPTSR